MNTIAKPKKFKENQGFLYLCKCGKSSTRSVGSWRIQCSCGKYQECPKARWTPPPTTPAQTIKAYREKQRYSQALLAEIIGISQGLLSDIEASQKPLSPDVAKLIRKNIPGMGI